VCVCTELPSTTLSAAAPSTNKRAVEDELIRLQQQTLAGVQQLVSIQ